MAYTINKTDGSVLSQVADGTIDQVSSDITLIGKNSVKYGEYLNENLVKILENFASGVQPAHPIAGQLWYDTTSASLKVFNGTTFKVSSGTVVAAAAPTNA